MLQLLKPTCLEPVLCNKQSHHTEKHYTCTTTETHQSQKINKFIKQIFWYFLLENLQFQVSCLIPSFIWVNFIVWCKIRFFFIHVAMLFSQHYLLKRWSFPTISSWYVCWGSVDYIDCTCVALFLCSLFYSIGAYMCS